LRYLLIIVFVLMMGEQPGAETYSWEDDTGTYHFTEDLSHVPKKYRNKMNRRGDMGRQETEPVNASQEKSTQADILKIEDSSAKSGGAPGGKTQLYGGKTYEAWRNELKAHETELTGLEQQLEQIMKQVTTTARLSRERQAELTKEYENTRQTYHQKYKQYSDLVESARKAGLVIEIMK